jgi:hypothetical protein
MAFTAGHVDFICYNEDNTTFPEATVMGWGATQVSVLLLCVVEPECWPTTTGLQCSLNLKK